MSITEEARGGGATSATATPGAPSSKRGSRKQRESLFHGVRKRSWGRYVSEIRLPGQKTRIWLGSFGSAEMAARAYDSAAFFLKGSSASLNFPEQVESLPRPVSSSRRDIQSAASKAALQLVQERTQLQTSAPETKPEVSNNNSNDSVELEEWWEYWDRFGEESLSTTPFQDAKDVPLMSPIRVGSTFGDLAWNEVFNFNDDILAIASTATL